MERRSLMIRLMLAGLLPGALLGATIGAALTYLANRQDEMPWLIGGGAGLGGLVGLLIGALIADHRCPP